MLRHNPARPSPLGPRAAKVLVISVVWLWLGWMCLPAALASPPQTQEKEKQTETTAQDEPINQPAPADGQAIDLSGEVVRDVLTGLQRGIETHNLDRFLDSFDPENMKDFPQFRDQMATFFRLYDSVKFRYQLLQVSSDKDLGFAIADIDMDADPSDILPTQQRRSTQMRFQMKRGPKGWKVIAMQPADFFNQ